MKLRLNKPIRLLKFMCDGFTPFTGKEFENLNDEYLPSKIYKIDDPQKIEQCKWGYHAVPIDGIEGWVEPNYSAYIVEVSGVIDIKRSHRFSKIAAENIQFIAKIPNYLWKIQNSNDERDCLLHIDSAEILQDIAKEKGVISLSWWRMGLYIMLAILYKHCNNQE